MSFQLQKFDLKASIERGKEVYDIHCITCHMEKGEGLEGAFPPVAKADYLMADKAPFDQTNLERCIGRNDREW